VTRAEEIQLGLSGAWRLMLGRADGLRLLDISADGFWNSFYAIVLALPALVVSWVAISIELTGQPDLGSRAGIVARLAIVDLGAWLLPLVIMGLLARPAGLSSRFVHYVVASNWGSAIVVWMTLPPSLLRLAAPAAGDLASLLSLGLFGVSLVLTWRLTIAAVDKGVAVGSAVFAVMFVTSLVCLLVLQSLLGLSL